MMIQKLKLLVYKKIIYPYKVSRGNRKASILYKRTLREKRCYYGPFTGEFGHLLGHNLPFIAHLYSKGVAIDFCGLEIHKPFFIDEKGNHIVSSYAAVRDFFREFLPDGSKAPEPADVKQHTDGFITTAKSSGLPYWSHSDHFEYFESFRWWVLKKGLCKTFDLSKVYKTADEDAVVIFPRKINASFPHKVKDQNRNNGELWNYQEVAKTAAKYFSKVYVIGHPAFSADDLAASDKIEICLTNDNRFILEKCCNSKLIITPHSGTVYLGEYTNTPILIIYKGGRTIGDIEITKQFKKGLGERSSFNYAYSIEEIDSFLKNSKQ
jgi:hypothetical protein